MFPHKNLARKGLIQTYGTLVCINQTFWLPEELSMMWRRLADILYVIPACTSW